jgi:AbrB family looped-hinge helix DNA binding protein
MSPKPVSPEGSTSYGVFVLRDFGIAARNIDSKAYLPYVDRMSTLTVTAKGQVTLRKDVLEHLGVGPGEQIDVNKLPDGRIEVRAAPAGEISTLFGMLKRKGGPSLSVDEMNEFTQQGWSGKLGKKK